MSRPPLYRRGDTGAAVAEIRGKLTRLGLFSSGAPGAPDAFDDDCDRAVRHFQQQRGLSVDGIVGPETYRSLEEARWRLGDRVLTYAAGRLVVGDDVAELQRRLLDMGFDCGRVDGILGHETDHALREFQRNVGIPPDGTAGPATFKALGRLSHTVVGGHAQGMRETEQISRAGPALAGKVIVLDPGHGGPDRGNMAGDLTEANLAFDLAARIEGRLAVVGCIPFLTRGPDGSPDDVDRAHFANAAAADLVISVHVDGHATTSASGVATYYYGNDRHGRHSLTGEKLADLVQREIIARTDLVDCRTHPKTWDLLRRTRMPTVRIGLGYLTNPGDAARLASPQLRDTVAEAVVAAVQRLYLPADDDAITGTLRVDEIMRASR